jgi:hypothetical protein
VTDTERESAEPGSQVAHECYANVDVVNGVLCASECRTPDHKRCKGALRLS